MLRLETGLERESDTSVSLRHQIALERAEVSHVEQTQTIRTAQAAADDRDACFAAEAWQATGMVAALRAATVFADYQYTLGLCTSMRLRRHAQCGCQP